jgi:hypothetical protein
MARRRWAPAGALALALAVALSPLAHVTAFGLATPALPALTAPTDTFDATVTWNGEPASDASSALTAFSISSGQNASVNFTFSEPVGAPTATNASLVLWFCGLALSSEGIATTVVAGVGYAQMAWSFGSLYDLTEGVYELEAELTDAHGAVVYSQAFYVDAKAPFEVLSAIVLLAALLGGAEIYWATVTLRRARRERGWYRFR